jgi:CBS domain-containing protein
MKTVRQMLQAKGFDIWTIDPDNSVYDTLKLMAGKNVGALLVMREEKLLGIFSERDYARKMILKGKHSKDTLVMEVMTENPISVSPEKTVEECMELMTNNHVRHLPVFDGGRLFGIVSIGDVVKAIITEQKGTIADLENYITGKR